MPKKIIIGIVMIFSGLLGFMAMQPAEIHIEREVMIRVAPYKIFPYINSPQQGDNWIPWHEIDPQINISYSGPEAGVESASSWVSPGKMGTGQSMIIESIQNKSVKTQLTFTNPKQKSQIEEISLTPSEEGTLVHWSMTGKNSDMGWLKSLVMNRDKEVGDQIETGLNQLKTLIEKSQRKPASVESDEDEEDDD